MNKLAITAGGCCLLALAAGCTTSTSGTARSTTGAIAPSSGKAGPGPAGSASGDLVIAETTAPATFDPIASSLDTAEYAWQLSYEGLLETDSKGVIRPLLATGWTVSQDGLTYTFAIRKGVEFANGDSLTSADVVFSFDRLMTSGIPFSKNRLSALQSVSATDDYTAVFKLSAPDPGFLNVIGDPLLAGTAILDKKWASTHDPKTAMNGTGPFRFVSYTPNEEMDLARNANYWDKANAARVDKLTIKYMPQETTQVAALRSGAIKLMFPDAVSHAQLASDSSVAIDQVTSDNVLVLNLNTAKPPFDNVDVRRAVSLALDRDAIVKGAFLGAGQVSAQIPPTYSWAPADSSLPYQRANIAQAKQLLSAAGYPNGLDVTLNHFAGYTDYFDRFSELVKSELDAVGIRVKIVPNQQAVWLDQLNKGGAQFSDNEYGYGADPLLYLSLRPGRQGPPPSDVAAALQQAAKATNPQAYQQALVALEQAECEDAYPDIALAARTVWVAASKQVQGVALDPTLSRRFLAAVSIG